MIRGGVVPPDRDDTYYQADLLVTCVPPERGRRYPPAPVLIAEVVSESTAIDHGQKLDDYRQLPSIKEILLVASEERRVQHWRRDGARWVVDGLIDEADLRLATVADPIPLAAIYDGSGL
jgi:Uma2 family endonuclease